MADDDLTQGLDDLQRLAEEARGAVERVQASGGGLSLGGTEDAIATRKAMATARADLMRREREIKDMAAQVRRDMEAQMNAALEALAPIKKQVAQMQEGIWTVNLYLGREEQIEVLREGEPAPAETPIVVRQAVLYMDEESALNAEHGGIDAESIGKFVEWLGADPTHVDQVLPETRGMVAIKPRRTEIDYGDAYKNVMRNEANKATYFLIRNGGMVYAMWTDFEVGDRLVPTRDEFLIPMQDRYGKPIEPGSREWLEAEKGAKAKERHYMRVALILQGLIDRTEVFHPLPVEGLSMLTPAAYDAGYVVLLGDEEKVLTTGRKPFYEWLDERNALLRPGLRIVGNFALMRTSDREYGGYGPARIRPQHASYPQADVAHVIDRREDGGFVFLYKRTDKVTRYQDVPVPGRPGYVYRAQPVEHEPTKRASCWVSPEDRFIIPLDLVTIEECQDYLTARSERRAYMNMFPTLQAVIDTKRAEREAEAPMRALIAQEIVKAHGAEPGEDLDREVLDLVDWWKTANAWGRALAADEAKAIRMIVREYKARRDAVTDDTESLAVKALRLAHRGALVIARRKTGEYVVIEPQPRRWAKTKRSPYVREHRYSKRAEHVETVEWQAVSLSRLARMRILHESEAWTTWDKHPDLDRHLSDPEIDALAAEIATWADRPVAVGFDLGGNSDRRAWVYGLGEDPQWDGGLTHPDLSMQMDRSYWKRHKDGTVAFTSKGGRPQSTEATTSRRFRRDASVEPWEDGHGYDAQTVWFDDAAYAVLVEQRTRYAEMVEQWTALDEQRHALIASIEEQDRERAEAEAYVKFLEDYADPSLWGDYLAKHPIRGVELTRRGYREDKHPLVVVIADLVDRHVDLVGKTVREAIALHGQDEVVVHEDNWGQSKAKVADIEPGLLDYVFSVPEDDDGEEDEGDDEGDDDE